MIEDAIEQNIFQQSNDKTFVDKILGRQDADNIRKLMKKPNLEREDLNQVLNLLSSPHSKLWNFNDWDRHVQLKFFVWVREYARMGQLLYDYEDDLRRKENVCSTCEGFIKPRTSKDPVCKCSTNPEDIKYNEMVDKYNDLAEDIFLKYNYKVPYKKHKKIRKRKFLISFRTKQMLLNNMRQMQHNVKFLVDLYLNVGNTSLSISATAFREILSNKYEISYANPQAMGTQIEDSKTGGIFRK